MDPYVPEVEEGPSAKLTDESTSTSPVEDQIIDSNVATLQRDLIITETLRQQHLKVLLENLTSLMRADTKNPLIKDSPRLQPL